MLEDLKTGSRVVGLKQSLKAVEEERAEKVFVAHDATEKLVLPLITLCEEKNVSVEWTDTMAHLGKACGIKLGAAAAVLLR